MDSREADARRRAARATWPIVRSRLGDDASDALAAVTTATERVAMMWSLAESAWRVAGRSWPAYDRQNIPARLFRAGGARPDDDT